MKIAQINSLYELKKIICEFDGCGLKTRYTKTVFSCNNVNAKIIILGEAPGVAENLIGIPFCGKSGTLLKNMLLSVDIIKDKHVYLMNTVFWRPPNNRKPFASEIAVCKPFVNKQMALVNPSVILALGGTAASFLFNQQVCVNSVRKNIYYYYNNFLSKHIMFVVTFHPSYLLRKPEKKIIAWQDLIWIKKNILDKLNVNARVMKW